MANQVLYRKWRPRRFQDVVGQEPVTTTLLRAVGQGRVAHAYLFCGPRGTGKTSTARILAKAVNCRARQPGQGEPCGTCGACQAVDTGSLTDLIEIDAASNRGIDEIRSLREKARFAPGEAAYKVYIIDEAHMLTEAAFNAFLKTLEEPPPHAIFVLATTESHKLPATIISRCQRFDFRRLSTADVVQRLEQICHEERIEAEAEALRTVARAGGGSLRDATNVLEQLVTSYGNRVSLENVRGLLGLTSDERAFALAKFVLSGETAKALEAVNAVAAEGMDLRQFHRQVLDYLRGVLLMRSGVHDASDYSRETAQEMASLASKLPTEGVVKVVRLFGQVNLRYDAPSPLPLELAVVEATMPAEVAAPAAPQGREVPKRPPVTASASPAGNVPYNKPSPRSTAASGDEPAKPTSQPRRSTPTPVAPAPEAAATPLSPGAQWAAVVKSLSRYTGRRFSIGGLLRDCHPPKVENGALVLTFRHRSNMERLQMELEDPKCRHDVHQILEKALGYALEIRIEGADEGERSPSAGAPGPLVQAAIGMGARLVGEAKPEGEEKGEAEDAVQQEPA